MCTRKENGKKEELIPMLQNLLCKSQQVGIYEKKLKSINTRTKEEEEEE